MKSLVTFEAVKYRLRSLSSGRKMPKGVSLPHGLKSWSAPLVPRRLLPPRENGPMRTGGFGIAGQAKGVSRTGRTPMDLRQVLEDGIGLLHFFWGLLLTTVRRRKPRRLSLAAMVGTEGNWSSV